MKPSFFIGFVGGQGQHHGVAPSSFDGDRSQPQEGKTPLSFGKDRRQPHDTLRDS